MDIIVPEEYQSYYENNGKNPIRKYPDPVLREVAVAVTKFSGRIKRLAEMMSQLVKNYPECAGLAANQVGHNDRLFVMDYKGKVITLINPVILEQGPDAPCSGGCMSFPHLWAKVNYPSVIKLKACDVKGKERIFEFNNNYAAYAQHEIDHLNGILFIDKADPTSFYWKKYT